MRKSLLSIQIQSAINPVSMYHTGPICPYVSPLNQMLHRNMFAITGRSIGKTVTWGYRYA